MERLGNGSIRLPWRVAACALAVCLAGMAGAAGAQDAAAKPGAEAPPQDDAARAKREGYWIRVSLPIDDRAVRQIQQVVRRDLQGVKDARPILVFEFDLPAGAAGASYSTRFGDAYDLADFLSGDELNAATTVAYLPKPIKGHAVLVAMACQQIIMGEDATIGEAGIDEKVINETLRSAYAEIASRRRTVPTEIALGLIDKSRTVLKVNTGVGTEYVSPDDLKKLEQNHAIGPKEVVKRAGEPAQFTGSEGRKLGFVSFLAKDRPDAARALDLAPEIVQGDPAAEGGWHPVRVDLKGPIRAELVDKAERLIGDAVRLQGVNLICLWIDSPGGSPTDSIRLANYLAEKLHPNTVRTVAYIPREALADAAVIAMACDQVIMHPRAELGGAGAYQMSDAEIDAFRGTIRDALGPRKLRSWSLWAAMIDPKLDVYRCTRLGDTAYFSDEELGQEQPKAVGAKAMNWEKGDLVTSPDRPFQVQGTAAKEYHLATRTVDSFAEFKQFYNLENDPALLEPGWADVLIDALRQPPVAVLLLFLGGASLYIELHTPGLGIGGFLAAVCFLLFFWSRYLGGTAGWLEVTLFLAGVSCLLLEVFVLPGFGILGLGGGALVLASLVLASQTFFWPHNEYQFAQMEQTLLSIGAAGAGLVIAAWVLRRWLRRAPLLHQMFLPPPEGKEAEIISQREMLVDLRNLVGASGTTTTPLTPGGKARFGGNLVDVMAEGEFIPRATPVVVTEVHGSRVVVRPEGSG